MGTWSITDARAWARERLTEAGIDSVDADLRELLEWACDASSQWDLPAELNEDQAEKLRSAVGERALRRAFGLEGRCVVQAGNYPGFVLDEAPRRAADAAEARIGQAFAQGSKERCAEQVAGGFAREQGDVQGFCGHGF